MTLPAQAQQLDPAKPIRLIVGLAAGGGTDDTARLGAQKISESMKMTVLVENKAGGIFIPALREVTNAAPDGHTLYFISTSSLITQPLHPDYPLDIMKLVPVTEVATGPLILAARNGLGVKTIKELVDLANSKPGAIKFGAGGGTGSSLYLATELLKARTGIKITIVPYRGAGPALNDMLGDHIDAMFDAMPVMSVQAKEGKVTPLAVTGTKRSFALPNVPTIMESGLDYQIAGWYGLLAPPGTPAPIVQKLRDEVAKAVAPKDVVDTLASQGMEPRATQPAEWAKYMASEMAFYTKIIKDANIKP
jgi:tripartite-type tricarboxylate transporter receptor subunit TctC